MLDAERRILVANPAFASMFGFGDAELVGKSREEVLGHIAELAEDRAAFLARIAQPPEPVEEFTFARPRTRTLRRTWGHVAGASDDRRLAIWHDVTSEKALLAERDRQLYVDALTGIPNRRAAERALEVEQSRRERAQSPLSVVIVDIDHFKQVNDRFGHPIGDEVLGVVAATLDGEARLADTVARWGGEEFLAVLAVPLEGALAFAERARAAVERAPAPRVGHVTVSMGAAEAAAGEAPSAAIARADARLYEAKRGGRNRVLG